MKKANQNVLMAIALAVAALAIGVLIGMSFNNDEVAPEACLTALDDAETTQQLAGEGFYLMSDVIRSLEYGDYYAAERYATEFAENTEQAVEAMDEYNASADACRALADD